MKNVYHSQNQPSALSQAVAPVARVWLNIQDRVAGVFGFKSSGNLAWGVTGVGVGALLAAGTFPFLGATGAAITAVGATGVVENKVTRILAESDNKR